MFRILLYLAFLRIAISNGQNADGTYPESTSKINPHLLTRLENGEIPNVIISFIGGNEEPLERASSLRIDNRGERAKIIYQSLLEHFDQSQSGLEQILSTRSGTNGDINFIKFWISSQIWVSGADLKSIREITEDPQVAEIEESIMELLDGEDEEPNKGSADRPEADTIQWNIERVQAPEAWEELRGKGEGIVIGVLDTGVRFTHEALQNNYLGDYGWFDPYNKSLEPVDDTGHGTLVAGIAAGSRGVGVAPGSKWSACKGCSSGRCAVGYLLSCMQFFACPTLPDGSNPDCSMAPNVVANSWGGILLEMRQFETAIRVWHSVGIVPIFSIGNSNKCRTTSYPGNSGLVIGVGSIDIDNTIDLVFSSRGSYGNRIKPDIVAPGKRIVGPESFGDEEYAYNRGTSFACPNVAGVVALILSLDKEMGYPALRNILLSNTETEILNLEAKEFCDPVGDGEIVYPNNVFGYGLVNAFKSVKAIKDTKRM